MAGNAFKTIEKFWQVQNSRDYTQLIDLFADDAILEDPIYGRYEGKKAIGEFMTLMVEEMSKIDTYFEVEEIAGDETVAWAQWVAVSPQGRRKGCGLYKTSNGKLTYYRDYFDPEQKTE